jgi:cytochrome c oxidase subunit II
MMTAGYAGLLTLLAAILIALLTLYLTRLSQPRLDAKETSPTVYRIRSRYFVVLLVLLALSLVLTLPHAPYVSTRTATPELAVDVTGRMWSWDLEAARPNDHLARSARGELVLPAGRPVVFNVTGADVNHGFGLYDESGHVVAQTQAMPGYINHLYHTFKRPGIYRILCLEYCGLGHHVMSAAIEVR